jgi:rod shape determining protein RodA
MEPLRAHFRHLDLPLIISAVAIAALGLVTMNSFTGESPLFDRQVIWLCVALSVFVAASIIDWRFLRRTGIVVSIYLGLCGLLTAIFVTGSVFKGAQSWFNLGFAAFQPVELAKLALIILLAKYFSRRHVEIAHFRHILVSGVYAFILFALVAVQPDFGSAVIIFFIWLGMVLVSGISLKHLLAVGAAGALAFSALWFAGFEDYQKERISTFLNPLADIHGAGYNAYQSTIAVGSGGLLGKGIGYGTQSKLRFLPEYQTDFIFAAYAEEWGFIGILILLALFLTLVVSLARMASRGATNFETLFTMGIAIYVASHFIVHIGINIGLLPVTGTTLPFMSYGGSHLLAEFLGLGIAVGMRRYARATHRAAYGQEIAHAYDR